MQVFQDVPPPGRERLPHFPVVARQLESRHGADHRGHGLIAERLKAPRQLVAVMRPDQFFVPPDRRRLDAPPFPGAVAGHVRHHAMRVQLRVQIAARKVPEGRRRHAVRLHPRPAPRCRVPAPRLQQLCLHEVQRRAHRLVMRADHPPVAMQQRRQRHRLRRRQRDVQPRTVLVLTVAHAAETDVRARHMALKDGVEALRRDMPSQPQRPRRLSVP